MGRGAGAGYCQMLREAVDAEAQFAEDLLSGGVAGLSVRDMRQYLGYVADSRLQRLGITPVFHAKNPFTSWISKTFRN